MNETINLIEPDKRFKAIFKEMQNCDECLRLKIQKIIPSCCQEHLDMQTELYYNMQTELYYKYGRG